MFTLPSRYIIYCLIMTALGFGAKSMMVNMGVHLAVSTFFGSMLASFLGVRFAQRFRLPPQGAHRP